jgi:hypothetical protein
MLRSLSVFSAVAVALGTSRFPDSCAGLNMLPLWT